MRGQQRVNVATFVAIALIGGGNPVGVAIASDGSLLVADDVGNRVWRVSAGK